MKTILLFIAFTICLIGQAQVYDTSRTVINKDTFMVIGTTIQKSATFTVPAQTIPYSYPERTTRTVFKPYVSPTPVDTTPVPPPPPAGIDPNKIEGFGAGAIGGSNSARVDTVKNLNASGPGSLASLIGSNKTIRFAVSGTISGVRLYLSNISYLTIDATGKNIILDNNNNGDALSIGQNSHHIIIKGLKVTDAGNDGINVVDGAHDIVIQNCFSWANRDGNIDIADGYNVTVQYCILGTGAAGWGGAILITGRNVSLHHNLISPATPNEVGERGPLVHCNYSTVGSPNADIRNNLVWKWGRNGGSGSGYATAIAYNATANVVANYYYSTASPGSAVRRDDGYGSGATGKVYAFGNISGNTGVNPNSNSNRDSAYKIPALYTVTTETACEAARTILKYAGTNTKGPVEQAYIDAVTLSGCPVTVNAVGQGSDFRFNEGFELKPLSTTGVWFINKRPYLSAGRKLTDAEVEMYLDSKKKVKSGKQSFLQWNTPDSAPKIDTTQLPVLSLNDLSTFVTQTIGGYNAQKQYVRGELIRRIYSTFTGEQCELLSMWINELITIRLAQLYERALNKK